MSCPSALLLDMLTREAWRPLRCKAARQILAPN